MKKAYILLAIIVCLMGFTGVYMMTSSFSNPEFKTISNKFLVDRNSKQVVVDGAKQTTTEEETKSAENTNTSPSLNSELFGGYPRVWYVFMSVYEAKDPLEINLSDGGFGIYQATHSELPELVEGLYALDPSYYADLKQYVDNPSLYMAKCVKPHKWGSCRTYGEGSKVLRETCRQYVSDPAKTERWYNDCLTVHEATMSQALKKVLEYTGKTQDTIGAGTMATAYACKVRYSSDAVIFNGCYVGMSEDELIQTMNANCYNRSKDSRFICQVGLSKKINAEGVDIYSDVHCTHECGMDHGASPKYSWGHLFGKEGY